MSIDSDLARLLALKGRVLSFKDSSYDYDYWEKGCILIEGGLIKSVGDVSACFIPETTQIVDYGDDLILPGFIDAHAHYPQMNVIA